MRPRRESGFGQVSIFTVCAAFFISLSASADLPHGDYLAALRIASQKVQRKNALERGSAFALSSGVVRRLLGRFYEIGESWRVAALRVEPHQMRRTDDPHLLKDKAGRVGLFRYEVIEVERGIRPRVVVHVTQERAYGLDAVDPAVERITLVWDDCLKASAKSYSLRSGLVPVAVAPEGPRSSISALELFPLDVTEAMTSERQEAREFPELPEPLRKIARESGASLDVEKGSWYEQDDFFGRPVRFLWRHGEPWPAYLKTAHGVAILLPKEASGAFLKEASGASSGEER